MEALKKGDTSIKYTKGGSPHERFFYLSDTEYELKWGAPGEEKSNSDASIYLYDVIRCEAGRILCLKVEIGNMNTPKYRQADFPLHH